MFDINPSGAGPAKWVRVVARSPDRACSSEPAFAISYAYAQELAPMHGYMHGKYRRIAQELLSSGLPVSVGACTERPSDPRQSPPPTTSHISAHTPSRNSQLDFILRAVQRKQATNVS